MSRNFAYAFLLGVCMAILVAFLWILYFMFPVTLVYVRDGSLKNVQYFFPNGVFATMFELSYYFAAAGFVWGFLYSLFMDMVWIPTFERKTSS